MKAVTLDQLTRKLETIQHRSPEDFKALGVVADFVLERLKKEAVVDRGVRGRILARLQAAHACDREDGGGFEQIEPLGRIRQWRCLGCDRIITLD